MKNFYIYTNQRKDENGDFTNKICSYLTDRGCVCHETVNSQVEGIIVLGGDGTMLRAAREYVGRYIPLIGVNLGTLGYLAEVDKEEIEPALDSLIALHVINFNIYVNDCLLSTYSADGMIISTPTGSTAYNLSAGGPIVEPKARLIMMTPVCSHAMVNNRTIVLAEDDIIDIEIGTYKPDEAQEVNASFDGRCPVSLNEGDKIRIIRSDKVTKIMKLREVSFLETLREKMRM